MVTPAPPSVAELQPRAETSVLDRESEVPRERREERQRRLPELVGALPRIDVEDADPPETARAHVRHERRAEDGREAELGDRLRGDGVRRLVGGDDVERLARAEDALGDAPREALLELERAAV